MSDFVAIITDDKEGTLQKVIGPFFSEMEAEDAAQAFIDHKAKVWDTFQHISYDIEPIFKYDRALDDETRAACPEYADNGTCIHSDHTK